MQKENSRSYLKVYYLKEKKIYVNNVNKDHKHIDKSY